jgi:hypothetical protein
MHTQYVIDHQQLTHTIDFTIFGGVLFSEKKCLKNRLLEIYPIS